MHLPDGIGRLWLRRVGWLLLIWAASVLSLGAVAYVFRLFMKAAGLSG
ncbi:DUF2474 domain-containing protein [Sphingobium xenophagum]|jgi:hypothetical protein|nr:DUF2474 domain-containing protein [Sphingobium xenophagum]